MKKNGRNQKSKFFSLVPGVGNSIKLSTDKTHKEKKEKLTFSTSKSHIDFLKMKNLTSSKCLIVLLVLFSLFSVSSSQDDDEFETISVTTTKSDNLPSTLRVASSSSSDTLVDKTDKEEDESIEEDEYETQGDIDNDDKEKKQPKFLPPRRTGQPILEYIGGGLTIYFLVTYIIGRFSNSRRVKALSTILQPILKEQFSSVGIKSTDTMTGFSAESDSEYVSFSAGRRYCVGALFTLHLAPRQDLFRTILGIFFSNMRIRDSISIEIPLTAGDAFILALRGLPQTASQLTSPFGNTMKNPNPFAQEFELVNDEACHELERNPKTVKSFYRPIKVSQILSKGGESREINTSNTRGSTSQGGHGGEEGIVNSFSSRGAVSLENLEIFLEQKDIASTSYLGTALRSFIFNAAMLQSGGITADMRKGAPLPPARFRLHITDIPDLCHGFKTTHMCAPEGGRVTLFATLALPTSGGSDALMTLLPLAVQSVFSLVDSIGTSSLPSSSRLVVREDRNKLEGEKLEAIEAELEQRRQQEREKERELARNRMTEEERKAEDEREKERQRIKEFKKMKKQSMAQMKR